jgi:prepilin-type N-terminal cleavage/methylation domain
MMSVRTYQGFTLLEVLVALALMSALSLMSWRALDAVERSSVQLTAHADDTLGLIRVLGQMETDLQHQAGPGLQAHVDREGASRLHVFRTAREGRWQHVIWEFEDGTIRRSEGAPSRQLPLPPPSSPQTMLNAVKTFSIRGWLPKRGWTDLIDIAPPDTAAGLEIAIVRHRAGVDEIYRKVVLMP